MQKTAIFTLVMALAPTGLLAATITPAFQSIAGQGGNGTPEGMIGPVPNGADFIYLTTFLSDNDASDLAVLDSINGSTVHTDSFTVGQGAVLSYFFNFVTSDSSEYGDYAYARLVKSDTNQAVNLMFARAPESSASDMLSPAGGPVIDNGVVNQPGVGAFRNVDPGWEQAGVQDCYYKVCGATGWVLSEYTFTQAGTYFLQFGVFNATDGALHSALGLSSLKVAAVPLPAGGLLLAGGLMGLAALRRRKAQVAG